MTDSMTATITGTVHTRQAGSTLITEVHVQGRGKYPDRVTVWDLQIEDGAHVTVTGDLSWRRTERNGKTYFDVTLRHATVSPETRSVRDNDSGWGDDTGSGFPDVYTGAEDVPF